MQGKYCDENWYPNDYPAMSSLSLETSKSWGRSTPLCSHMQRIDRPCQKNLDLPHVPDLEFGVKSAASRYNVQRAKPGCKSRELTRMASSGKPERRNVDAIGSIAAFSAAPLFIPPSTFQVGPNLISWYATSTPASCCRPLLSGYPPVCKL